MCVFVRALARNCFAMAEQNDISYVLRHRCAIEFCVNLGKCGEELLDMMIIIIVTAVETSNLT
jgi:hypothetical protein